MLNMGPGTGWAWVPVVHPSGTHPAPHHPGTHPHPGYTSLAWLYMPYGAHAVSVRLNMAVGLISVRQLSLCAQISGSGELTEVYNLVGIGRINNHL